MSAYTLEEKLNWALDGKSRWEVRLAAAETATERASEMGGGIPGFGGSGSQRAANQVRSAFNSADRAWREASEKLEYYTDKARGYQRRIEERDRVRLTRADLDGARLIRDSIGWRYVVRVNAKTVTVRSELHPDWTDRVPFEQIREVRS